MLNCDADAERLTRITARLNRLSIPFERFAAAAAPGDLPQYKDPDLRAGHWACGLSHILLLREIHRRQIDCALVLEDDAILRDDLLDQLEQAASDIDAAPWDLLYLGCHILREGAGFWHGQVIQVQDAFHTHAYLVRRKAIPMIIMAIAHRLAAMDGPFDEMRYPGLKRARLMPMLAIQEPGYSHTTGGQKDRTRQYFPFGDNAAEFRAHCQEFRQLARLGVVTLWDDRLNDIAPLMLESKRAYCLAQRLPFHAHHGKLHKDRPAAWSKLPLLLDEMQRNEWTFWSDADALFMRDDIDLRSFLDDDYDLIWSIDGSGPNTGNFFLRNTPAARELLEKADALYDQTSPDYRPKRFKGQWEQAAIREIIDSGRAPNLRIKTIPKRSINSYDTDYESGDFILHLPGHGKLGRLLNFIRATALSPL